MAKRDANQGARLFNQALLAEPGNMSALVGGAALPQVYGRNDTAIEQLEALVAKGRQWPASINLARLYLPINPMRSTRLLNDCLTAKYGDREQLLNYLGEALWAADQKGVASPTLQQISADYLRVDADLPQAHRGQTRWGTRWLPAKDAEAKWKTLRQSHDAVVRASQAVEKEQSALVQLEQQYADAKVRLELDLQASKRHKQNMQAFEKAIADAKRRLAGAQRALNVARANWNKTEKPPFPAEIPLYAP
ncbi:MAG: hypothetical protein ACTHLN_05885 [Tepidisphaeraceae bacterium]